MATISVITPCFNEELNIRECYEVVLQLFASAGRLRSRASAK